ncbi:hypothetical protein [Ligilactobacillus salivarius]|uniref:hypothetical protein n=1 Tax=Ligilactobacillus salivarius TaxID=1624 RepID=UPI0021509383|nr:hypothetical protein [Ligilactobacillus salivarius]MDH4960920.1 hypothetical protein [Ligilactobacillus salivarius]UUY24172.1 hypothetical protein NUU06_04315 [Ligilactobacillus salivarius]
MTNDEKMKTALGMLSEYAKSYQAYVQSVIEQPNDDSVEDNLFTTDKLRPSMPGTTKSYISNMAHSLMSMANTLQRIEDKLSDNAYERGDDDGK